jgi:hypothetical protein
LHDRDDDRARGRDRDRSRVVAVAAAAFAPASWSAGRRDSWPCGDDFTAATNDDDDDDSDDDAAACCCFSCFSGASDLGPLRSPALRPPSATRREADCDRPLRGAWVIPVIVKGGVFCVALGLALLPPPPPLS